MLPNLIEIVPLEKSVQAEITVPGSKSITNRALILAALAEGEVKLEGALWSEDTQIMVECLQELGFMVDVRPDANESCNRTITVYGQSGEVPPGGTESQPLELFVGNAGTAARFLAAFVCLGRGVYRLHGIERMHERPQAALFSALRELGYRIEAEKGNERLPVRIWGDFATGQQGDDGTRNALRRACRVSIEQSSQFASALLLCASEGQWKVEIVGENAEESPYVAMTSKLIEAFPRQGGRFVIEPDASSGSYFWDLEPNRVSVARWPKSGWQIDQRFPLFTGIKTAISRINDLGDSIMTAIVIAPLRSEPVQFTDLGRLRVQECERVVALRTELTKCGAKVIEEGDTLTVYPSTLHGAEIETYNDHRMAMCFAILGLKVAGIKIKNPACVKKTFPNFFQKLAAAPPHGLGATVLNAATGEGLTHEQLFAH
ncbi:MAG TPA: 3-phosphoshikimate 1-carboxyvinyltransferase [Verrucomicrobiae bacterium]|nr:3-phosphoshikimate 1-carboxyvinyltransferase [Verrucomicrobiae bacterium]